MALVRSEMVGICGQEQDDVVRTFFTLVVAVETTWCFMAN